MPRGYYGSSRPQPQQAQLPDAAAAPPAIVGASFETGGDGPPPTGWKAAVVTAAVLTGAVMLGAVTTSFTGKRRRRPARSPYRSMY